jgi:hypothetical protein
MCNFDLLDLAASLGKSFRLSCGKAGGGKEVPWSYTLHRESVGRGGRARRCVEGGGLQSDVYVRVLQQ